MIATEICCVRVCCYVGSHGSMIAAEINGMCAFHLVFELRIYI